ncbi:MAG: DNA sulfur modification protein DndB [Planctomycetes bacterium]|nr:DNA sulfur modification protein DndB [Planctomycetota bacterium]
MNQFELSVPALRGYQGGSVFYSALVPIRLLPRLLPINENGEGRSSRGGALQANTTRGRAIAQHLLESAKGGLFPPITIAIHQPVQFEPGSRAGAIKPVAGQLIISFDAEMSVIDGADLIWAIRRVLPERPDIRDDYLTVMFHIDPDRTRIGQIYSDLSLYHHTAPKSVRIGLDTRDADARLTREVAARTPVFQNAIEMEKTTISNRSRKLFTLSALYQANQELLADRQNLPFKQRVKLAVEFWSEVATHTPGWKAVVAGDDSAAEIRARFIHCHGIGLSALARAGRVLLKQSPDNWKKTLAGLDTLDWSRDNKAVWEGTAMIGGRLSKSNTAIAQAGYVVMRHLGLKRVTDGG